MVRCHTRFYPFFINLLILFFLSIQNCYCQYFQIGTDPASVRWNHIKTLHFHLIYPESWEDKARYIASGFEYIYHEGSKSLYQHTPATPVILHTLSTIPSSETYIAPRRMEFYTSPPQDIFPQDWVDQLIIHEFRHAVQYSAINTGFTRGLYYALGEHGVFAMFGLFLPMWFIEGDATVTETALHNTGRGRSPWFEMRLRSQIVDKGIYSFEKATNGSFRDFVAGKYELGYQLVGRSRVDFGRDIWGEALKNVGKRPYTIVPFSSGIKKQTGFDKYQLYDTLTRQMEKTWKEEDKLLHENEYQVITKPLPKLYTNYNLPITFRDSLKIAVKSSLDDLSKIVLINPDGTTRDLCTLGVNYYLESLTASDSVIYWSERVVDPRWVFRDYRVIKSFNFNNRKTKQLTHRSRYYAPAVTNDGKYLAAVEVTPDNEYSLVILNSSDGTLKKRISTPDNLLFIHPRWSEDGRSIVSIVFGKNGNNLALTDPETGRTETLLPYSDMEMKRPSFYGKYILYTASYNGKDNIYAFNRTTREVSQVTSSRFGASDAFIEGKSSIIYSNYTSDGYQIVSEKPDTSSWKKITIPVKSAFPLAELLTKQENFIYNSDSVPVINYHSKPYSKALSLFNFHSWIPVGIDFQDFSAGPGITLRSQNLLETTITDLGYLYNWNEGTSKYFTSISNETFYPAIDLGLNYGGRKSMGIYTSNDSIPEKWKEFNLLAGLRLPLNWTHNYWLRGFQPSVTLNYKLLKMENQVPVRFDHTELTSLNFAMISYNRMKTSQRDIYSKWGQQLQVNYNYTPFNNELNSVFAAQLSLDFPGLMRHHALHLYGGYQKKTSTFYTYSDYISFPRGYTGIPGDEVYSFSTWYTMPLSYPDMRIGHLFYFKRFKIRLFYDYAQCPGKLQSKYYSSTGLDLSSDFGFINLIAPFDAGIRTIYKPSTGGLVFEPHISFNLGAMY